MRLCLRVIQASRCRASCATRARWSACVLLGLPSVCGLNPAMGVDVGGARDTGSAGVPCRQLGVAGICQVRRVGASVHGSVRAVRHAPCGGQGCPRLPHVSAPSRADDDLTARQHICSRSGTLSLFHVRTINSYNWHLYENTPGGPEVKETCLVICYHPSIYMSPVSSECAGFLEGRGKSGRCGVMVRGAGWCPTHSRPPTGRAAGRWPQQRTGQRWSS